ncbi:hemolysin family protein [Brachymonas denitrificans]|uniref:hemolysin family protein n=1 Tax=Brachymonas denitrificans TaxID=28220 RepID=UPI003220A153
MDLLLIIFLTLLNGVFAMSEMAIASSRKARLDAMSASGDQGATAALRLIDNPTHFLSTVQIGITSIGVLNGIVGEAAFSPLVAALLQELGMPAGPAGVTATALVVTFITFTTIIFGELVPKRIGQIYPELVARWIARPMARLARLTRPFVLLLSASTTAVLRLLPIDTSGSRKVTEEEIAASLEEGVDAGLIEEHEHQMVQNVFLLDDRVLSSIMVPRNEIDWFDAQTTVAEALRMLHGSMENAADHHIHSWYPVCRDTLDNVIGVVNVGRIMLAENVDDSQTLESIAMPATFVPETLSGMELLEQFRTQVGRMVIVVDEYGEIQGLMTPRDLLEAITGELKTDSHEEAWAQQTEDGAWLLDGMIPVSELKARLEIEELPDEDKDHYNTLAGLLMYVTGSLPEETDRIFCTGWDFEVVDLDGKRIDKVIARKSPSAS